MTRLFAFSVVLVAAIACQMAGLPLWPVFLALALVLLALSGAYRDRSSFMVALLIGAGILIMTLPAPEPFKWKAAILLWLMIALALVEFNPWSAFFAWAMPVGYLGLAWSPLGAPAEAWWAIVEVSGVISLLCAGGPLDQFVGDCKRVLSRSRHHSGVVGHRAKNRAVLERQDAQG